jgi:hypothetical protein
MSTALSLAISAGAVIVASLLGALVGARVSGVTARELDELARRRDDDRTRASVRAAAAFIRADLDASRRRLREAMTDGEWHVFYRLPTAAWRDHGPTIATSLAPDDVARIAHSFARIEDFERAMSTLPVRRYGLVFSGAPRPIRFDKGMREKVKEIAGLTGVALSLLESLAPHARQPPPLRPGQKSVWPTTRPPRSSRAL